jgi:hypothetical protein
MNKILLTLAFIAALMLAAAKADVVTTTEGRTIEGKVIKSDDAEVVIQVKGGAITLKRSEVASIEKKPLPEEEYVERAAGIPPDNAVAHVELAKWCREKGLDEQYKTELERAVGIDPDNADARKMRGEIKVEGKWVDRASYEDEAKNPWKKEIRAKLAAKLDLDFAELSIEEFAAEIEKIIGAPASVDAKVIKDFKAKKGRILGRVPGLTLGAALDRILSTNSLDYTLKDKGLLILYRTRPYTVEEMNRHLDERVVNQIATLKELPLSDILNALKAQLRINLRIDDRVYETRKPETLLIKCNYKNMTLRKHLESILQEMNLDFIVRPNEILITTKELAAEARGETKPEKKDKPEGGDAPKPSEEKK